MAELYIPKEDTRPRVWTQGVYYIPEGDNRMHQDMFMLYHLNKLIPEYANDSCPRCGNKNIVGCRCHIAHRFCENCGASWRYVVDKKQATIKLIIAKDLTEL